MLAPGTDPIRRQWLHFGEEGGQAGLGLCSDFRPNAGIFGLSDLPEEAYNRIQAEQLDLIQCV
jgi:hypothetical protein